MENFFVYFINLLYIKVYFDKGLVGSEDYEPKPFFALNLLKGSVNDPNCISFTKSALNGYIGGDPIAPVVNALRDAKFSPELLDIHITGLYETKHKNTQTYQDRFNGKNYKQALYERVKDKYPEITPDNMSSILAKHFSDKMGIVASQESVQNENIQITYSYTISESDKKEIKNICELIDESLLSLQKQGTIIDGLLSIIHNYDNEPHWRLGQWKRLKQKIESYNNEYTNCSQFCSALIIRLRTKIRIKKCIENLYNISNDIVKQKYIASQKDFNHDALCKMIKSFQDNHKLLLDCINTL